jgi:hypothetical protein
MVTGDRLAERNRVTMSVLWGTICRSARWSAERLVALILNPNLQKPICLPSVVKQAVWPGREITGPNAFTQESVPCDGDVWFACSC